MDRSSGSVVTSGRRLPWSPKAVLLVVLYMAIAAFPLTVASLYGESVRNVVYQLGLSFALLAFVVLALQFVLASRLKWTERPFGFDIEIRFHKCMGIFALFLLIAHPLLLASGAGSPGLIIGIGVPWYIWVGRATLVILLLSVFLSAFQLALRIKFEHWRLIHDILSPAVVALGFVHSMSAGQDLRMPALQVFWIVAFTVVALLFVYHRILRPRRLRDNPYRVVEVAPEAEGVWSVKLAPPQGSEVYDYLSGQFHFLTFFRGRGLPVEEHHWTISSSPAQKGYISSTIKALGDFTATMGQTRPGDTAAVHGPFGRFSYQLFPGERDVVFIAGGIGITPFMSMIRHMRDTHDIRRVVLLYANRSEDRIVFKDELAAIEIGDYPVLKVVHVLSEPGADWAGEKGTIGQDTIRKYCGTDLQGKAFYLCGPPAMVDAVAVHLKGLGVSDRQIRSEIFSFLH